MKFSADCKCKSCCLLLRNNLRNCLMSLCFSMKKYRLLSACCGAHEDKNQPWVAGRCFSQEGVVRTPAHIPALGVVLWSPSNTTSPFCVGNDGQCAVVCLQLACLLEWGQTFVFHVVCREFELERPKSVILCQHGIDRRFCDPKVPFHPSLLLSVHAQVLWNSSEIQP